MNGGEVVIRVAGAALGVEPEAEIAGTVIEAGEAAREWLGRRVVVPRVLPCGECGRCRRGHTASCPARASRRGQATEETVPAKFLCSVEPPLWPRELPDDELWRLAALADAAAAPFAALARAGMGPGELIVIFGGGPRGAFAAAIACAKGAHPVVIDSRAERITRAQKLGARTLDGDAAPDEHKGALARLADELGAPAHGFTLLETTATPSGRHRALATLSDGGTAVLLDGGDDLAHPLPATPWESLARAEAHVIGAGPAHPDLYPELCALAARGELPLVELTRAISPAEMADALAARRAGRTDEVLIVRR